jgi:hypothetical protein
MMLIIPKASDELLVCGKYAPNVGCNNISERRV